MNNKRAGFSYLLTALVIGVLLAGIIVTGFFGKNTFEKNGSSVEQVELSIDKPSQSNFTANFSIITSGAERVFTSGKYHNLSDEVFIQAPDPNIINVRKSGITWGDFFKTLPMLLTDECLVTGDGQTYCSDETNKLRFILNDVEIVGVLDKQIMPDDLLLIRYDAL